MKKILGLIFCASFLLAFFAACAVPPSAPASQTTLKPAPSGERIPLIFSHDGAPDDISALAYIARHPRIDLIGVINSYGEQHPSRSADKWARYLYEVIDLDNVPIGVGSEISVDPAQNQFPQGWRDGADNFWRLNLPEASREYTFIDGSDLLIDLVRNSAQPVTILVTGAHTDMALALRKDPAIAGNIERIVVMGGAFNMGGNLVESVGYEGNEVAEWNIFVDPLAAKEVFNAGIPLSVVSLDGSDNFVIKKGDIWKIRESSDPVLVLLTELWDWASSSWGGDFKIWDIVAAVALTNPEFFTWQAAALDVVAEPGAAHGQTLARDDAASLSRYTAAADFEAVKRQVFEILLAVE